MKRTPKSESVSVRLPESEIEVLKEKARSLGFGSMSSYIRYIALNAKLEKPEITVKDYRK